MYLNAVGSPSVAYTFQAVYDELKLIENDVVGSFKPMPVKKTEFEKRLFIN